MVPVLRNILAQPRSTVTFNRLMNEGAIVVCDLSKGRLGESTAHLLGALPASPGRPPRSQRKRRETPRSALKKRGAGGPPTPTGIFLQVLKITSSWRD
jgi:hypothetical protein